MNKLYDKKFYETNQKDVVAAEKILPPILKTLKIKSVIDFGCGFGTWLYIAKKYGCKDILGLDGDYIKPEWQLIDQENFQTADLTKHIKLDKKYDLAISLEVAEHIAENYSETYLENLTSASDIILFSAAIPGQDGTGHVNGQYPTYWIEKFKKFGYEVVDCLRSKYWADSDISFWYRQNIMFFVKENLVKGFKEKFEVRQMPYDLVHPERLKNICYELKKSIYPKVSIVVPVYNVKTYLRECLDSILNQTLKDIEVLCGDGGSTDGSLEILREYEKKDPRVKVISREKSGYGQSVNECMDLAKGEYIGIVESDDKVDCTMYETLYNIAKENDLDWIRSDIYYYYSDRPLEKQYEKEEITCGLDIYNRILDPKFDVRPYKTALRTWSGIYKKEFLDFNHIRHHETPGGSYQDVGFFLKTLYYARRVYFFDKPFYMWRQDNPGSSIHYDSKKLVEKSVNEWELNKQYLLTSLDTNEWMWGSYNYRRLLSYKWTIDKAIGKDKNEILLFAKKELKSAMENNQIVRDFYDDKEWQKLQEFIK